MATLEVEDLIPLFYWNSEYTPRDRIIIGIPALKRLALAGILCKGNAIDKNQSAKLAKCLICNDILNSEDFTICGYKYPKDSDHYVLNHGVWLPEQCDYLIDLAYKKMRAKRRATGYM